MDPFEVYKLYLALKLHFTTETYDITKHRGRLKGKRESFEKRKDKAVFNKYAKNYTKREVIDLFVANFVNGDKWGGVFDVSAPTIYKEWLTKKNRLWYTFSTDLDMLELELEKSGEKSVIYSDQHSVLIKSYLGKKISLETLVIFNKYHPFTTLYKTDILLKELCLLIEKYSPFLRIDKEKYFNEFDEKMLRLKNVEN